MLQANPKRTAAIAGLAARHKLPCVLVARACGDGEVETLAVSAESGAESGAEAAPLFPVASVTKLATALAVLRLVAGGQMALDDDLAAHLPEARAAVDGITLRTLLCHTSGLPNDVAPQLAPYAPGLTWELLARACLATEGVRAPWTRVVYSNVGYGLLALVVERRTRLPFATALAGLVLDPLRVEGYLGVEPPRSPMPVAGNLGEHAGTPLEPFNSPFWRSLAMPWAGLVTTAAGALALVQAFAGRPHGFLPEELRQAAAGDQTGGLGGGFGGLLEWDPCPWGLGPEVLGHKAAHMLPPATSPASFGHSGYSGSLAWADPTACAGAGLAFAVLGGTRVLSGWRTFWQPVGELLAEASPGSSD